MPKQKPRPFVRYRREEKAPVIGMLYIVDVRMVKKDTNEKIKHRILMVGSEASDIEKKLSWVFDLTQFDEFGVEGIEKVREKIHIISTTITQERSEPAAIIERETRTQEIGHQKRIIERYDPKLYAVGVVTTMVAKDPEHALRKVGRALINDATGLSHAGASLSEDSTVTVEHIPFSSGYALPRDVSSEVNPASFVRG